MSIFADDSLASRVGTLNRSSENLKTIKFLSVRRTDMSNILSVRPIFYRSGINSPKISAIINRSAGQTTSKMCRSGRIFVGPRPTDRWFSYSLEVVCGAMYIKFLSYVKVGDNILSYVNGIHWLFH